MKLEAETKKQIRTLEIYSFTQGALLVFLAAWFRYGPGLLMIEVPAEVLPMLLGFKVLTYGVLGVILVSYLCILYFQIKLRRLIFA